MPTLSRLARRAYPGVMDYGTYPQNGGTDPMIGDIHNGASIASAPPGMIQPTGIGDFGPMGAPPRTGGVKSPSGPFGPPTWSGSPVNYGNGGLNYGGDGVPSWSIRGFGNDTFQGPGNAGSNNFARGAINGQTMPRQNGQQYKAAAVDFRMGHSTPGGSTIADRDPQQWAAQQQKQAHNDAFAQWLQGQGLPMPGVGQGSDLLRQFYAANPQWAPGQGGTGNMAGLF